jgi:mercuric ion transport protein
MPVLRATRGMSDPASDRGARKRAQGYLWGALAVLACPCHLPVFAAVLAGTSFGALVSEHWAIAAATLTGLFVLSVVAAVRAFRTRS